VGVGHIVALSAGIKRNWQRTGIDIIWREDRQLVVWLLDRPGCGEFGSSGECS
jgi:hypothetical protein